MRLFERYGMIENIAMIVLLIGLGAAFVVALLAFIIYKGIQND
jgi:hypothetical protein